MDGIPSWVWIALALIALAIIIGIIVAATSGRRAEVKRDEAAAIREKAAETDSTLAARQDRFNDVSGRAEATRAAAFSETEKAAALHAEAEAAEERAAQASAEVEVLDIEVARTQEDLDAATKDREDLLRQADRIDPDVRTDRRGNRLTEDRDVDMEADDRDGDGDLTEVVPGRDNGQGSHVAERTPGYDRDADEDLRMSDAGRPIDDTTDADDVPARAEDIFDTDHARDEQGRRLALDGNPIEDVAVDGDIPRDDLGRRLDPYGNPVSESPYDDDFPRDELGRRLDPYGNPVPDERL